MPIDPVVRALFGPYERQVAFLRQVQHWALRATGILRWAAARA